VSERPASGPGLLITAVGDSGVLVELDGPDRVLALDAALRVEPLPGVIDVVPAERTVLIRYDPARVDATGVARWVREVPAAPTGPGRGAAVRIPVRYDGEDLDEIGRLTGLGPDGVVAAHTGTPWRVAFTGFAPGFGYLVGGDPRLRVPRLDVPRVRVPAGAVALAGAYSGVYPRSSPGGWRLLGSTDLPVWDPDRDPPALLSPGVEVHFVALPDAGPGAGGAL
jgi:KipI family sensor histidine kinase inhibitor